MCGIWRRPPRPPLPPESLDRILAEPFLASGLTHVNVTGGEPVNHPDLPGIAAVLSDRCPALREVNVNTSGLNPDLTESVLPAFRARLADRIAFQATFSLDGVGPLHDRVRGAKGAFANTTESLDRCRRLVAEGLAMRLHLNCTVSRQNYQGVKEVVAFARAEGIGVSLTSAAVNGLYLSNTGHTDHFVPGDGQTAEVSAVFGSLCDDEGFPLTERHYYGMVRRMLDGEPRPCKCVYQNRGVFLDLDGQVYPCGTAPDLPYGRLPDEPFEDVYLGPRGDAVRRELLARHCPSCPTNSYHGLADGVWLEVLRERRSRA